MAAPAGLPTPGSANPSAPSPSPGGASTTPAAGSGPNRIVRPALDQDLFGKPPPVPKRKSPYNYRAPSPR